jgi:hypothetical protein
MTSIYEITVCDLRTLKFFTHELDMWLDEFEKCSDVSNCITRVELDRAKIKKTLEQHDTVVFMVDKRTVTIKYRPIIDNAVDMDWCKRIINGSGYFSLFGE